MIFIHYGSKHFDKEMFDRPIVRGEPVRSLNKPLNGFWGSPVHSKKSWSHFCLTEKYNLSCLHKHFLFKLKDSARVLKVLNMRDLSYLYRKYGIRIEYGRRSLDWKRIVKSYDAMILMLPDDFDQLLDFNLVTWDVDSIVIFNPDVVVELPKRSRVC